MVKNIEKLDSLSKKLDNNEILKGLMVAINLNDIGAEIVEDKVVIKDSFEKIKKLVPILAFSGVTEFYLYGGFFEMSKVSKIIHQVPTKGKYFIRSNGSLVKLASYETKRKERISPVNNEKIILKDNFGNPFSINDHRRLNSLLKRDQSENVSIENEFKELVKVIKEYKIKLTVDFIPWLSQDIINCENYRWTFYKNFDSEKKEFLINMDDINKEITLQQIMDLPENNKFVLIQIEEKKKQKFILSARLAFYGIYSADQVALNAMIPVVQDYYISSMKKLVDLGIDAVRVDLGHLLLKKYMKELYFSILPKHKKDELSKKEEPWERIISEVNDYSKKKCNTNFDFYMESYHTTDRDQLLELGAKRVYYKELYDSYINVVKNDGSVRKIKSAVSYVLFKKINGYSTIVFPSNFDEQSLGIIGGPKKALTILLITLAHLGVNVMVDLREWLDHKGHIIPMVGGYDNHPFITQEELNSRYNYIKHEKQIENAFWKKQIDFFKKVVVTKKEEFIEFVDNSNLDKYLSFAWKTEKKNWYLLVCNFSIKTQSESIMWVDLPKELIKTEYQNIRTIIESNYNYNEKDNNQEHVLFKEISNNETFWRIKLEFNEDEEFKILKLSSY